MPRARIACASLAACSTVPVVMVISVSRLAPAPPKKAQSGMPAWRVHASSRAVSIAHCAEPIGPIALRTAAASRRHSRTSAPSTVVRAASTAACAIAWVSPLKAGKGAASP